MDEKRIYEWLRPELKGKDWTLLGSDLGAHTAAIRKQGEMGEFRSSRYLELPPLDMNTAFAEAIPKLVAEGCEVSLDQWADSNGEFVEWSLNEDQFVAPHFWEVVGQYLEED